MAGLFAGAEKELRQATSGSKTALIARGARGAVDVVWAGCAVGALAWFALSMTHSGRVAAIWPANAVIVARLVRASPRHWLAYLLAGLVGNICGDMLCGDAPLAATVLSFCNTLEITACAVLVRRFIGIKPDLSKPRQLAIYASVAVLSSAVAASVGALWLAQTDGHSFWRSMAVWTFADVLGLMVVAPALMVLDRPGLRFFLTPGRRLRNLGMVALLATMITLVGLQPHHQFTYLIFAALMVVAYKGETTGAAVGLLTTGGAFMALSALGLGDGMAKSADPAMEAVLVQLFMLAGAVIAFPIAGAMTRRRELQATLAVTARDFQMLAENSTDVILRIDRALTVLYVSPACRQLGYEPVELIGRRVDTLVGPEEQAFVRNFLEAILRRDAEPDVTFEQRVRTKSGEWAWIEGAPRLLFDADGQATGLVTQLRDVTARHAARVALAEERGALSPARRPRHRHHHADGCGRGHPTSRPPAAGSATRPSEMIGARHSTSSIPTTGKSPWRGRSPVRRRTTPARRGPRVPRPDQGRRLPLAGGMSALSRNEAGELVDVVSHLRDVTERRAFEDELRRKRAEAEAATLAKSEFLANMSHEIRTPLTGIMGFAGLLLEEQTDLSPAARTYATRIATASRTLAHRRQRHPGLLQDRGRPGRAGPPAVRSDPVRGRDGGAGLAAGPREGARAQHRDRRSAARCGFRRRAAAAPGAAEPADQRDQVHRVRRRHRHTRPRCADGGRLKISVTDTGVGIAPDRLHRLFQRFSQADGSINRQYGGTGLGLAICRSLTTLMGGEIGVESTSGLGAQFWFTVKAPASEP
jgi:PAS domain S-box-containing protein